MRLIIFTFLLEACFIVKSQEIQEETSSETSEQSSKLGQLIDEFDEYLGPIDELINAFGILTNGGNRRQRIGKLEKKVDSLTIHSKSVLQNYNSTVTELQDYLSSVKEANEEFQKETYQLQLLFDNTKNLRFTIGNLQSLFNRPLIDVVQETPDLEFKWWVVYSLKKYVNDVYTEIQNVESRIEVEQLEPGIQGFIREYISAIEGLSGDLEENGFKGQLPVKLNLDNQETSFNEVIARLDISIDDNSSSLNRAVELTKRFEFKFLSYLNNRVRITNGISESIAEKEAQLKVVEIPD